MAEAETRAAAQASLQLLHKVGATSLDPGAEKERPKEKPLFDRLLEAVERSTTEGAADADVSANMDVDASLGDDAAPAGLEGEELAKFEAARELYRTERAKYTSNCKQSAAELREQRDSSKRAAEDVRQSQKTRAKTAAAEGAAADKVKRAISFSVATPEPGCSGLNSPVPVL